MIFVSYFVVVPGAASATAVARRLRTGTVVDVVVHRTALAPAPGPVLALRLPRLARLLRLSARPGASPGKQTQKITKRKIQPSAFYDWFQIFEV